MISYKNQFNHFFILFLSLFLVNLGVEAQEKLDEEYGKRIKEYTTGPEYLNPLVDHLPASESVPTPLDFFGDISGAPDILHYSHEIYAYFRALEEASPRVKVRSIGKTEEDREMLEVVIADEETLAQLDLYQDQLGKLADPRKINDAEAQEIIRQAKPVYYFTAAIHSPETGSPEMVMEMAYRLAVGESEFIKNIRNNVITVITPLVEVDGRDRQVDLYKWRDANQGVTPPLVYWGHYVAHDNNRDGYGLSLNLTRNILNNFLKWNATVLHDLHESVPYLYVSTGQGPYNPYYDATVVNEWNRLAYADVDQLSSHNNPGAWTWGFYNGWAASYLFSIGNLHNAVGRFYETFGNSVPQTLERKLDARATSSEWFRMNPPLEKTMWSLRNNNNYMQTGSLTSLDYVATHRTKFLENFYFRSKKSVESGKTTAPYAFVIPKNQTRKLATIRLINLLKDHGVEIHEAPSVAWKNKDKEQKIEEGAYIVRMDQPKRTVIGTLLDQQLFPENYEPPYDDVGWTLSYLFQVQSFKVEDENILNSQMQLVPEKVILPGELKNSDQAYYLVNNSTDDEIGRFRLQLPEVPMQSATASFSSQGTEFGAGSLIIETKNLSSKNKKAVEEKAKELGLTVTGVSQKPNVDVSDTKVPRVGLVHTWLTSPQNEGWWRIVFDKYGIPYEYISFQTLRNLKPSDFDVLIIPDNRESVSSLINGSEVGPPIPWKKTKLTPNIGIIDETDDIRKGMGFEGAANLKKFVQQGGVLITDAGSAAIPIELGITKHISIKQTKNLQTSGSVFNLQVTDPKSPITYGYQDTLAVYFNQRPVFDVDTTLERSNYRAYLTPESIKDQQWNEEYPRVVMRFHQDKEKLLLSGMLKGGEELAGIPAVIDATVGKGHVVMFANHPFWRWETHGSHSLVLNTLLNWNNLRLGFPDRPKE